ncbi:hypothetical protein X798_02487 [Onchocerca flexuosa]|uniref:Uncharacterized protein n=1 Tax=Onchocerca flexuosa TaxID=387005 RepID=A0A238BZC7_9BILA|nr:hypothetical protein X798_02487 [Onchocerca flexuosa]
MTYVSSHDDDDIPAPVFHSSPPLPSSTTYSVYSLAFCKILQSNTPTFSETSSPSCFPVEIISSISSSRILLSKLHSITLKKKKEKKPVLPII